MPKTKRQSHRTLNNKQKIYDRARKAQSPEQIKTTQHIKRNERSKRCMQQARARIKMYNSLVNYSDEMVNAAQKFDSIIEQS